MSSDIIRFYRIHGSDRRVYCAVMPGGLNTWIHDGDRMYRDYVKADPSAFTNFEELSEKELREIDPDFFRDCLDFPCGSNDPLEEKMTILEFNRYRYALHRSMEGKNDYPGVQSISLCTP